MWWQWERWSLVHGDDDELPWLAGVRQNKRQSQPVRCDDACQRDIKGSAVADAVPHRPGGQHANRPCNHPGPLVEPDHELTIEKDAAVAAGRQARLTIAVVKRPPGPSTANTHQAGRQGQWQRRSGACRRAKGSGVLFFFKKKTENLPCRAPNSILSSFGLKSSKTVTNAPHKWVLPNLWWFFQCPSSLPT